MSARTLLVPSFAATLLFGGSAFAQGEAAVPFLLINVSPSQNGMGGAAVGFPDEHSMAPVGNPAQLGLFSLRNSFSAGFYAPKTDWLPEYNLSDLTFNATALNAGCNFADLVDLPFPVSLGIGYSRISLNLGTFTITNSSGPIPISTFQSYEKSEQLTLGLGIDWFVRLGVGVGFKFIESNLAPVGTEQEKGSGSASTSATDFGVMLQIPVLDVASSFGAGSMEILPGIDPLFDLNAGFVRSNIGGSIMYLDPAQADPLPRNAQIGASAKVGLKGAGRGVSLELISVTIAREAEQLLVERHADGSWRYLDGFGQIGFADNVIGGMTSGKVGTRKGWQIEIGEFVAIRSGSVELAGLSYTTSGFGVRLSGLLKGLRYLSPSDFEGTWLDWALASIDLGYDYSAFGDRRFGSGLNGTNFHSLNLLIRTLPI